MRLLGFINTFDELAEPDRRLGRKVANFDLARALLEHSSADELHFFLPFAGALEPFQRVYGPWLTPEVRKRLRLVHAAQLPALMASQPYGAIHAADLDNYFPELCHLRNHLVPRPFPITCTTHTLSYWAGHLRQIYKVLPGPLPCDAVFCTSRAARRHLERLFGGLADNLQGMGMTSAGFAGRLEVVPLGVRAEEFGREEPAAARKALGLPAQGVLLLCVGRLTPADKFDLMPLLGVLSLLAPRHDLHLVLAGAARGDYPRRLEEAAGRLGLQDRLHLLADFPSQIKHRIYAACDILVSPADNLQETFGLTILEAMASGLPVVASDFSGYRDLVAQGETGFLIPTLGPSHWESLDRLRPLLADHIAALQVAQRTALDLEALRRRLEELAGSTELRRRMGKAGLKRVLQRFDWPRVIQRMEETWQRLGREAPRIQPPPADLLNLGLGRIFGHFFSRGLSPGERLRAGPLAPAFLNGSWAAQEMPDLVGGLPREGLRALLEAVERQNGHATLAQTTEALAGGFSPEQVEHLVLHALKYGLLAPA